MKLKTDRTIKNIVVIAVVFIVMSVGVSSLYNAIARKMINDEVLKMVEADSGDMTKKFDRIIGEVDQISRYLLIDMDVQNYILTGKTTSVIGNLRTNMENKISAYRYVYDYIHSINICSDESVDKYFDGMNESTIAGEKPLWKEAYDNCIGSCLLTRKKDNAYPIIMTFIRKTTLQGKSGGIIINIDLNNLSEILGDGNSEYQKRYIIDDEGNIVYKYKIRNFDEKIPEYISYSSENESYISNRDKYMYAVSVTHSEKSEYKCIVENQIDTTRISHVRNIRFCGKSCVSDI